MPGLPPLRAEPVAILVTQRGTVYFTTKGDDRVRGYDTRRKRLRLSYDGRATPDAPLHGVDNVTITPSGGVLVAEDHSNDNLELVMLDAGRPRRRRSCV